MMIFLLDLNYTLVANSEQKLYPFSKQIINEQYRTDLIEKLQGHIVNLITARPKKYQEETLRSICAKTNWLPCNFYFNYLNLPPPQFKEVILKKYFLEQYKHADLLAVESNPRTRSMYGRYSIPSYSYEDFIKLEEHRWNTLLMK